MSEREVARRRAFVVIPLVAWFDIVSFLSLARRDDFGGLVGAVVSLVIIGPLIGLLLLAPPIWILMNVRSNAWLAAAGALVAALTAVVLVATDSSESSTAGILLLNIPMFGSAIAAVGWLGDRAQRRLVRR